MHLVELRIVVPSALDAFWNQLCYIVLRRLRILNDHVLSIADLPARLQIYEIVLLSLDEIGHRALRLIVQLVMRFNQVTLQLV